jgi:hypothetical protein
MTAFLQRSAAITACVALLPLLAACGGGEPDRLANADRPAPTALALNAPAQAASADPNAPGGEFSRVIQVYKTPTCGCCTAWVDRMKEAGFEVETLDLNDLTGVKMEHGVPRNLASCHTSRVGGYLVEGHVPADAIERLLRERPEIHGIAVPGMPVGSPGMEGPYREAYNIVAIGLDGAQSIFDRRN